MTAGRKINTKNKDWNTPPKYVMAVKEVFNGQIDLDPCSNEFSTVGAKIQYVLPIDGLKKHWNYNKIYVNPPYGLDKERHTSIKDWLKKCFETSQYGSEVIALIPVATNTKHWKEYVFKSNSICFLADTRLKFWENGVENKKGAPMACAMIYWGNNSDIFDKVFSKYGFILKPK